MTTVGAAFVGCKVSQADGEEALAGLAAAGLEAVPSGAGADVVIVHTCCVTAEAERKSRRLARRLAGGGRRVLVAGCAAVLHPEQFAAEGLAVVGRPDWAELGRELAAQGGQIGRAHV
jgi:threonylcarbamoyladenosine tRNA methylthiotransferase MtaB